jgi:hypothetical protein
MHAIAYSLFSSVSLILAINLFFAGRSGFTFFTTFGMSDFLRGEFSVTLWVIFLITWKLLSNYWSGIQGEKKVSNFLEKSGEDKHFLFNDVTFPDCYGNMDHVITSQYGIFVLETKNNRGTVKFNSKENWNLGGRAPIAQVNGNARTLFYQIKDSGILNHYMQFIKGIVVFPNASVKKANQDTLACSLSELPSLLEKLSSKYEQYTEEELEKINRFILDNSKIADSSNNVIKIIWEDFRNLFNI